MNTQLLREQEIYPSKDVLQNALGKVYPVLEALEAQLTHEEFALTFDWKYYKDSKAWLCKAAYKKKTIFWLSVWEGYFRASFFFLERHLEGIAALGICEKSYTTEQEWGKMIPLIFCINSKKQFSDLLKMVRYKKTAK
jgi:hypothetical protein